MIYKVSYSQFKLLVESKESETYRKWISLYLNSKKWSKSKSHHENLLKVMNLGTNETAFEAYDQWNDDGSEVRILAISNEIYSFIRQVLKVPHSYIEHFVLEWFNKKFGEKCEVSHTF